MFDHYYAVIMAGGGGTRLWPLSRKNRPKQMLSLFDERSLFQTSIQRLDGVFPPERILVVTVAEQAIDLMSQTPEIPPHNFLIEPGPRGTASVVGLAAAALINRDPDAVMAILTADHFIGQEDEFRRLLKVAYQAADDGHLVTLGITPTFPSTGFGYIHHSEHIADYDGVSVLKVQSFTEKPDMEHALTMLESGDYVWNSGMFFWRAANIWEEFRRQMPDLFAGLETIRANWNTPQRQEVVTAVWNNLSTQTIDYGIMEHASRVVVIPAAGLNWNDVGSWESLYEVLPGDENGNIVIGGAHIGLDTQSSLIYVQQDRRLIVTIGIDDLVLVDTGDVLLVCKKDQAQRVRQVVNQLKQTGQNYL